LYRGEKLAEKAKEAFEENKDKIIKGATNLRKKVSWIMENKINNEFIFKI